MNVLEKEKKNKRENMKEDQRRNIKVGGVNIKLNTINVCK
jgi:hypothetical protein